VTGETIFGVKQCTERLFKIVKEHCDERGHWVKDPNLTVAFTLVNKSITVRDLIIEYAKSGFERMRSTKLPILEEFEEHRKKAENKAASLSIEELKNRAISSRKRPSSTQVSS